MVGALKLAEVTFGDFEVYVLNTFLQVGGPLPMQGSLSDPVASREEAVVRCKTHDSCERPGRSSSCKLITCNLTYIYIYYIIYVLLYVHAYIVLIYYKYILNKRGAKKVILS